MGVPLPAWLHRSLGIVGNRWALEHAGLRQLVLETAMGRLSWG